MFINYKQSMMADHDGADWKVIAMIESEIGGGSFGGKNLQWIVKPEKKCYK